MYWVLIVIGVLAFFVWASADVGSGVYLKTQCRRRTDAPYVALTFDDGPDEAMTPRVLELLKQHGVKATFFLIGERVRRHPEIVRRIVDEGHLIGNHTYTHSALFPLSGGRSVRREIEETQRAVEEAVGIRMRLFRPPFGVTNPILGRVVRSCGLQAVGWSIRSFDTVGRIARKRVCDRIGKALHRGAVILLHDRCREADLLLEGVLKEIAACGLQAVRLDKLFEMKEYEN